ncbi:helix-turn-helix transcriptional regulator [Paenibacillus sp. JDR-2]|uniref:helix-turn-helix transcriptional regulator n=1 Tax=Paenibacillus sp. (strain JDR-2) TaxID=324057 RepID=UPI000166ADBC|nr:AraC family transcriptional regulator [Paenibacillus sp. JDR-2]ACT04758.1 transcriptional regulator, AraC family [Paenibacillus sp. JDR-2]
MLLNSNYEFLNEMLQHLQVHLEEAYYTQCSPQWRELDYIPSYNKFYLICEGEGWLNIDGQDYRPVPGQLVHMPAHVLQSYSAVSDRPYSKYWCHFTATMGEMDLFQWLEIPPILDISPDHTDSLTKLFRELVELYQNRSYLARIREKAILLEIIALFLSHSDTHLKFVPGRLGEIERLKQIEAFIEANLSEALTLEQLAKHVHLHPNYLVRYFNKHFAVPPLKYLNRKRMQKAKSLLGTTDLAIKEIAELVGFPDTNHFAKAFRKEASCSPTEYRHRAGRN